MVGVMVGVMPTINTPHEHHYVPATSHLLPVACGTWEWSGGVVWVVEW